MPLTNAEKRRYYESRGYILDIEPSEQRIDHMFRMAVFHHRFEERKAWVAFAAPVFCGVLKAGQTKEDAAILASASADSMLAEYRAHFGTYPEET